VIKESGHVIRSGLISSPLSCLYILCVHVMVGLDFINQVRITVPFPQLLAPLTDLCSLHQDQGSLNKLLLFLPVARFEMHHHLQLIVTSAGHTILGVKLVFDSYIGPSLIVIVCRPLIVSPIYSRHSCHHPTLSSILLLVPNGTGAFSVGDVITTEFYKQSTVRIIIRRSWIFGAVLRMTVGIVGFITFDSASIVISVSHLLLFSVQDAQVYSYHKNHCLQNWQIILQFHHFLHR
jgi:hypothetical protein